MAIRAHAVVLAAALAVCAFAPAGRAQRFVGPFQGLAGAWRGNGAIEMRDGNREAIRCRARYAVSRAGDALSQDLRCASDSYRIEVRSAIENEGGALSGTWSERERNVTGTLSGRVNGGSIEARVVGQGFSAQVTVRTSGNAQSVTIAPEGGDIRSVAVTMRRG